MKTTKAILYSFFLLTFLFTTSCTSDSNKAAGLFCENSELKADLDKAMETNDEEKIKEISETIYENNSELEELFLKHKDDEKSEEFYEKLLSELEKCENISKEEIEKIKEYIKNPVVKMPQRRVRNTD
jgi:intergrase/recombinase